MTQRLAIVASHPIQYQDPLFRLIAADRDIDLTVLYCSRHGAEAYRDADMGTTLRWDLEMLQGYRHRFLRNLAGDPNAGYARLINPGIVPALARGGFDAVIFMMGWGSITALLGMATCRFVRRPFFLYGDSSFPRPETTPKARLRAGFLRALFAMTTGFMVSGALNADYYRHYGADPSTFFLLPWAVDNARFEEAGRMTADGRLALRERYGIGPDEIVILYSAKLVARKEPMTLLRAFARMKQRASLLFLGDGPLREPLERAVHDGGIERVRFAGFINQRELPRHYGIGDVFVLPSSYEPRGAVINEAMVLGLPIVVTDRCGSIGDIVLENENAFIYPAGDAGALTCHLDRLAGDAALRARMGARSRDIIANWDFARGVEGVKSMLRWVRTR